MKKLELSRYTDTELLDTPISRLACGRVLAFVRKYKTKLILELESKGIFVKPKIWCSTDWFSPDGDIGFAFPFYLLDERLKKIYLDHFYDLDGVNGDEIMRLFRHEMAHAIDNALGLRRLKKRQQLFGASSSKYPKLYHPKLNSFDYIHNLEDGYGQSHPDEDWAETFAVWLSGEELGNVSEIAKTKYNYLKYIMENKVPAESFSYRRRGVSYDENIFDEEISFIKFIEMKKREYRSCFKLPKLKFIDKKDCYDQVLHITGGSAYSNIISRNLYNCADRLNEKIIHPTSYLKEKNIPKSKLERIIM